MKNRIGATVALIASLSSVFCASGVSAKLGDANQVAAARLITGTQYPAIVTVGADVMDSSVPLILKSEGTLGFQKCTFIVDVNADRISERVHGKLREVVCYNSDGAKFSSMNLAIQNLRDNLTDPNHSAGLHGRLITKQAGLMRGFGKKTDDVSYVQVLAGQKAGILVHQDVELIYQAPEGQLGSKRLAK